MESPPALPCVDAPPTAAVEMIEDLSSAWTTTLPALTTVLAGVELPPPITAETSFLMVLMTAPPCPANCPVARPKPIATDWIFEESSAVISTSPVVTVICVWLMKAECVVEMASTTMATPMLFLPAWRIPAIEVIAAPGPLPTPPLSTAPLKSTQACEPLEVMQLSLASWPLLVLRTSDASALSRPLSSMLTAFTLTLPPETVTVLEVI